MAALMALSVGCPIPTNFQKEPPPPNYPPVVEVEETDSCFQSETVVINARPMWKLMVSDANVEDELSVKVLKDLHLNWGATPTSPVITLLETSVATTDVPPPDEGFPEEMRSKTLELSYSPCPAGSEGTQAVLTVCISDRGFVTETNDTFPCLPTPGQGGYVTSYSVLVQCIAAP